jgi:hypothetical protein
MESIDAGFFPEVALIFSRTATITDNPAAIFHIGKIRILSDILNDKKMAFSQMRSDGIQKWSPCCDIFIRNDKNANGFHRQYGCQIQYSLAAKDYFCWKIKIERFYFAPGKLYSVF